MAAAMTLRKTTTFMVEALLKGEVVVLIWLLGEPLEYVGCSVSRKFLDLLVAMGIVGVIIHDSIKGGGRHER